MRKLVVLAILATLLAGACAPPQTPTTGSIGVNNSTTYNWIIYVDTLVAGTVAAGSSTTIGNLNPGVHTVSGSTPPGYIEPSQWVTVDAGQTTWVNWSP